MTAQNDDSGRAPGGERPPLGRDIYRAVLDRLPQKVFLKDRDSVYVLCNEAYAADLKLRPGDLEGRTDLDFFPRELADKYRADDRRTMEKGVPEEFDEDYVSGGERRTIHTVKTPVRGADGSVSGVLGIFWDVTESVRAHEDLVASEAKFRSLFTQVSDLVLLLDISPEGLPVIADVSDSVSPLLGYSRDELIGESVHVLDADLVHADSARMKAVVEERLRAVSEGRSFIVRHLRKDGGVREFECAASAQTPGPGGLAISVERDISERRKAEAEIRFRAALLDNATDAIHALELDGRIIYVNETVVRTTGYSREELLGMRVSDLDSSHDAELSAKRLDKLSAEGSGRFRILRVRKDGTSFPVEAYARVAELEGRKFIIAVDRDITERERAEADLRESFEIQRALNKILQHALSPQPIKKKLEDHLATLLSLPWLSIEPKGAIFLTSGTTLVLTAQRGLAPELLSACARLPFGKCLCGRAAQTGEVVTASCLNPDHEISVSGLAPHGHYCAPISADGKVLGVLNLYLTEGTRVTGKRLDFLRAATDILAGDILRAKTEEQLTQSQKMDAVGHLAGGVAHDFNNILSAIMGFSSFLHASIPPEDPKRADVEEILKAGERAAELTRHLLAFSRKQAVETEALDLDLVVTETVKMMRRMIPEGINLETALNSAPARVTGNRGQLEQVLVNLAVNARDAMPGGGTLAFESSLVELEAGRTAPPQHLPPGGYVRLTVSDTGGGIPDDIAPHIFEPFFTTKEPGKGTGLGLSTVYGIVRQNGGDITVHSEQGAGTVFSIYFPAAAVKGDACPLTKPAVASLRGTETVLLAEDDEAIRKFVARLLAQNGYNVLEASAPKAALEICRGRRDIALLLTDMVMPEMTGYELAKAASALIPGLKVVLMSGYADGTASGRAAMQEGLPILDKPLKSETLLRKLRETLH